MFINKKRYSELMENNENPNLLTDVIRVREKNEITIPKKVREILGVEPGDYIQFEGDDNGGVNIHKIIPQKVYNSIENYQQNEGKM